jgi:hypothetical protein
MRLFSVGRGGNIGSSHQNQAVQLLQVSLNDYFIIDSRQYHGGAAVFCYGADVSEVRDGLFSAGILIDFVNAGYPYHRRRGRGFVLTARCRQDHGKTKFCEPLSHPLRPLSFIYNRSIA